MPTALNWSLRSGQIHPSVKELLIVLIFGSNPINPKKNKHDVSNWYHFLSHIKVIFFMMINLNIQKHGYLFEKKNHTLFHDSLILLENDLIDSDGDLLDQAAEGSLVVAEVPPQEVDVGTWEFLLFTSLVRNYCNWGDPCRFMSIFCWNYGMNYRFITFYYILLSYFDYNLVHVSVLIPCRIL